MEHARHKRKGKRASKGGAVGVSTALHSMLRDLGIDRTVARYDVINSWPDIVGEKIARVTVPERVDRGILFVSVTTAAWRTELTLNRTAILKKINALVGSGAVKDIRFR
jgi:predicted nucleic acid-binding Zn ribbon protein